MIKKRTSPDRGIIDIVFGKSLLAFLSAWGQKDYGMSFGVVALINEIISEEIPEEMKNTITAIEKMNTFSNI